MDIPTLRSASAVDAAFIYAVNELTLRPHVEAVSRKWAAAKMHEKCAKDSVDLNTRIVRVGGVDCGVFNLEIGPTEIWLHSMLLLAEFQRRGIGRYLLQGALAEAMARGIPIRLLVMRANPARLYYEGFGFTVCEEADQYFAMQMIPVLREGVGG